LTTRRSWLALLVAAGLAWTAGAVPAVAQGKDIVVVRGREPEERGSNDIAGQWQAAKPERKRSFPTRPATRSSSRSSRGAPADIFISADLDWMDYGQQKDLIRPDSRSNLLGNRLVLIAPKDSSVKANIQPGFDLAAPAQGRPTCHGQTSMRCRRASMAKASLEKLGVWDSVKEQDCAGGKCPRGPCSLCPRGEAPLGIVYQTDAAADPNVKIVGTFPEDTHPPIIYPVALTKESTNADARRRS